MPHSGHCLCGNVTITVEGESQTSQIACHCTDCQHSSGSAHSTNILAPISDVKFAGETKEYNAKAASGNTVTRIFCSNCGSALAHKSKAFEPKMAVQTGNLPDFRKIPFEAELFCKDRWTGLADLPGAQQVQIMPE